MSFETIYYSVYSNEYENGNFSGFDVLGEVRRKYFLEKKKQKDRVTKKMFGKVYNYLYSIEMDKPMKWKKMVDGEILERCRPNNDFYEILYLDDNKRLFKMDKFNLAHEWIKTDYFISSHESGPVMTVMPNKDSEMLSVREYQKKINAFENYFLFPEKTNNDNKLISHLPKVICSTSDGDILFYKESDKNEIKGDEDMGRKKIFEDQSSRDYIYFGDIKNKIRHGHGRVIDVNERTTFEGEYSGDKKEGLGVCFNKDGEISYVGNFKSDKKHGIGISFKADSKLVHVGRWENDLPLSMSSLWETNGDLLFTGNLEDSKKEGFCMLFNKNKNKILAGKWENGEFLGKGVIFDISGEIEVSGEISQELTRDFFSAR